MKMMRWAEIPLPSINRRERAAKVLAGLKARYPEMKAHLNFSNAWELLVATVLSAQCTDQRVNSVTPQLFGRWPTPVLLGRAAPEEVEEIIRSTGFFRNKARNIIEASAIVADKFAGEVPANMEDLLTLPGVARKTANVVLFNAFGLNEGLAVDTHVKRLAKRLDLTGSDNPERVEQDLMAVFPREEWGGVNHRMVSFGRDVCNAKSPLCSRCEMNSFCPSAV